MQSALHIALVYQMYASNICANRKKKRRSTNEKKIPGDCTKRNLIFYYLIILRGIEVGITFY